MEKDLIEIDGFGRESVSIHVNESGETLTGHSGGDAGLVRDFVQAMRTENLEELKASPRWSVPCKVILSLWRLKSPRKSGGSPVNLQKLRKKRSSCLPSYSMSTNISRGKPRKMQVFMKNDHGTAYENDL